MAILAPCQDMNRIVSARCVTALLLVTAVCLCISSSGVNADDLPAVQESAEAGNLNAQLELVEYYSKQETQDLQKGLNWLKRALQNGAYFMESALEPYEMLVAEAGNSLDYDAFLKRADSGDPGALFVVGTALVLGMAPEMDIEKGIRYLEPVAKSGNVTAQVLLANTCFTMATMTGNEEYISRGFDWAKMAAELGNSYAQALLAGHYIRDGNGAKAIKWALAAYRQGSASGAATVGNLYAYGMEDLQPQPEKAVKPLEDAYAAGHPTAAETLGFMYLDGRGVEKDPVKARRYLEFAAAHGMQEAINQLQYMDTNEAGRQEEK